MNAEYKRIGKLVDKGSKGKEYTLVMGDWNAIVGEGKGREGKNALPHAPMKQLST